MLLWLMHLSGASAFIFGYWDNDSALLELTLSCPLWSILNHQTNRTILNVRRTSYHLSRVFLASAKLVKADLQFPTIHLGGAESWSWVPTKPTGKARGAWRYTTSTSRLRALAWLISKYKDTMFLIVPVTPPYAPMPACLTLHFFFLHQNLALFQHRGISFLTQVFTTTVF